MTTDDIRTDPVIRALAALPTHEPDRLHAVRVRARCHKALGSPRWPARLAPPETGAFWSSALEPAVVGVISVVLLSDVVRRALQIFGF